MLYNPKVLTSPNVCQDSVWVPASYGVATEGQCSCPDVAQVVPALWKTLCLSLLFSQYPPQQGLPAVLLQGALSGACVQLEGVLPTLHRREKCIDKQKHICYEAAANGTFP